MLASLEAVGAELRASEGFQKAVDLMAHIAAARRLWLYRFGIAEQPPAEFFPRNVALVDLVRRVQEVEERWSSFLARLTEADVARVFEYQSWDGPSFRNTVEDILAQLFGHSWYHRGQIALLLRSIGAEPAVTDFVFWTREPLSRELHPGE